MELVHASLDVIPNGAAWEHSLIENIRRRHMGNEKKKKEANACKVRLNSLSIHHPWLKHTSENNPTHN